MHGLVAGGEVEGRIGQSGYREGAMVVQGEFGVATELKIVTCRSVSHSAVSDSLQPRGL